MQAKFCYFLIRKAPRRKAADHTLLDILIMPLSNDERGWVMTSLSAIGMSMIPPVVFV